MLEWADSPIGVGDAPGGDLTAYAEAAPGVPPRERKVRRRPNNGRKKRTNRNPLKEPPWDRLRELGIYVPPTLTNLPTTPVNWRRGDQYRLWKPRVFAMWGTTCHLCGHPEAYSADHLIPLSEWSNQPYDPHLSRPAHGVKQPDGTEGCPTCGVKCNSSRGNKQLAIEIGQYKPPVSL